MALFLAAVLSVLAYAQNSAVPADQRAAKLLRELGEELPKAMTATQEQLLGNWTPAKPSCIKYIAAGELAPGKMHGLTAWPDGGVGMKLTCLYTGETRGDNPKSDFYWHQGLFRRALLNQLELARKGMAMHSPLATQAAELADIFEKLPSWPGAIEPAKLSTEPNNWPLHCLAKLDDAATAGDLVAARLWSRELASAAFAMEDLHRWLEFLFENQLTSLDFQAKCEDLFATTVDAFKGHYVPCGDISGFPAGTLGLHQLDNYLEVERQAELLYSVPEPYVAAVAKDQDVPAARRLPPDARAAFSELRSKLTGANAKTWDRAASMPFERSFMANMLFRCGKAGVIDRVGTVLARMNAADPNATVSELMDAIFYRGGTPLAALEWADRFDPRLMENSKDLAGLPQQTLVGAHTRLKQMMGDKAQYGSVLTLREAMDVKRMDCIRATDMIGSLYRNAGGAGFFSIRWCAGYEGHTTAAVEIDHETKHVALIDGLATPPKMLETWPSAFYQGHEWPPVLRGSPDAYAVELSGRGLDNYVWMEGYVIRGPSAGTQMRAQVPFRDDYPKATVEKVYDGPYPK